ncbi:acyl-CoA thioester hydrolase [Paenibacillus sophorae]|uniref:Acyl-CoA thioester hydrolase n=1 Tax=Paenibacillus sophorae TaxID=1333845 RepID=A0A1H8MJQ0_9BACL|nr:thioesterase family protein [Paenibacillus sophorae]QWU17844.1 acyl-CoA thioesterase [Paenibacillus sophorae]SEO17652.1 acyl-CoA thioester hydrolase [Paenibacillus sophorae]
METQDFLPGPWHAASLRVRYQESDQMGVVYHSNYLNWFEIGRTEMLRGLGFSYLELENRGVLLPVTSAELQFKRSAKYDDTIAVYARMSSFTPLRLAFDYEVRRVSGQELSGSGLYGSDAAVLHNNNGESFAAGFLASAAGELLVTGSTGHAWVNREFRPVRLDRTLPQVYGAIVEALRKEKGTI